MKKGYYHLYEADVRFGYVGDTFLLWANTLTEASTIAQHFVITSPAFRGFSEDDITLLSVRKCPPEAAQVFAQDDTVRLPSPDNYLTFHESSLKELVKWK